MQDFDADVQRAVHRIQPAAQVFDLMAAARALQFQSINVDLIYGLPRQPVTLFDRTLAQVCKLRPDRIALYAYAHLPDRFKPQRRIATAELPGAATKIEMLSRSISTLTAAGYVYIGMDHFALATDHIDQGRLPVVRGLALSRDDVRRRSVIMAIMCQGHVSFESIDIANLIDFKDTSPPNWRRSAHWLPKAS